MTLLYFHTITFQTRFAFSKGQLNTSFDLSLASSLQGISNVRDFTKRVFFFLGGGHFSVQNSTPEQVISLYYLRLGVF